jgi:hypothetical protein
MLMSANSLFLRRLRIAILTLFQNMVIPLGGGAGQAARSRSVTT